MAQPLFPWTGWCCWVGLLVSPLLFGHGRPVLGSCFAGGSALSSQHMESGSQNPRVTGHPLREYLPMKCGSPGLHSGLCILSLPLHPGIPWGGATPLPFQKTLGGWYASTATWTHIWSPYLLDPRAGSYQLLLNTGSGHRPRKRVSVPELTGI